MFSFLGWFFSRMHVYETERQRELTGKRPYACKERIPTASISTTQDKCNRRAVPFRKLFDCSASHIQECLKMQGCRAKLKTCGVKWSIFQLAKCTKNGLFLKKS